MIASISDGVQKMVNPKQPRRSSRRVFSFVAIALLALVIRIWNLGLESLWIDEAYSISLSQYNVFDIVRGTAADQHPPLYYLILHFWLLLGNSAKFARLLSVILGVIHIVLVIRIGEIIANLKLGIISGFILAILPIHVWYSQEARMYMLLTLLTTAATLELITFQHSKSHWIRYCALLTLSFYTHYFTVFVVLSHTIAAVLQYILERRKSIFVRVTFAQVVSVAFFLPWMPTAYRQVTEHTMPWIEAPTLLSLRDVTLRMLFGDEVLHVLTQFQWPLFALSLSFIIIGGLSVAKTRRLRREYIGILFIWTFTPLLIIYYVSLSYPIYQYKQHLIIATPLILSFVAACWALPKHSWIVPIMLALSLQLNSLWVQQNSILKDDWNALASFLNSNSQEKDLIYANPAAVSLPLEFYTAIDTRFKGYPPGYSILTGGWNGETIREASIDYISLGLDEEFQRIWFIEYYPSFWDPDHQIEKQLALLGNSVFDQNFQNIRVRLFVPGL